MKWTDEQIEKEIRGAMKELNLETLPTSKQLRESNHGNLSKAIERNGGFLTWTNKLGLKQKMNDDVKLYIDTFHGIKPMTEMAECLGVSKSSIHSYIKRRKVQKQGVREYAVYRGEYFIQTGTKREIMQDLDISSTTFDFYATPAYRERVNDIGDSLVIVNLGIWALDEEKVYKNLQKIDGSVLKKGSIEQEVPYWMEQADPSRINVECESNK